MTQSDIARKMISIAEFAFQYFLYLAKHQHIAKNYRFSYELNIVIRVVSPYGM